MTLSKPSLLRLAAAALALAASAAVEPGARAQLKVDITRGTLEPLPIAVTDLIGAGAEETAVGKRIAGVVVADLERSGLFRALDPAAFIQAPPAIGVQPRFGDWRLVNAQALVHGRVALGPGEVRVEFRLWDVFAEKHLDGARYKTVPDNWRRIAHRIADRVYRRITGEDGYFDTRIAYIDESGPPVRRIKRLAIMDQDGENHRYLTDGLTLTLTPRFSPTEQTLTFLSYADGRPRVHLYNIDTGAREVLGDFPGMNFAPRFSPDGKKVVMSVSENGNAEIYMMDLGTRRIRRLTDHPAIDTSPSLSPDGARLAFNSDRGGSRQIYVMEVDGGAARRISDGEGQYTTPVWSPRGDLIAFTRNLGGEYAIGIMRPDGGGERILVTDFLVEGPTWAPNGRVLMYFKQARQRPGEAKPGPRLHSIDLTGFNERRVPTPRDASDPAWSPLKR